MVAAGCLWAWAVLRPRPGVDAERAASAVRAALESGEVPDGLFTGSAGQVQQEYDELLRGMRPLRPAVSVRQVMVGDAGVASAVLGWDWVVHAGKAPWTYTTTVRLVREGDGGVWRAVWDRRVVHGELDAGERLVPRRLAAQRGELRGEDGRPLVFRQAGERVGIDKSLVDAATAEASAGELAGILGVEPGPLVARVRAATPRAFVEAAFLRTGDAAQRARLVSAKEVAGVRGFHEQRMLARTPRFARSVLGIVGEATAEIIEESRGEIRPGDVVGLSGLQRTQDARLRGVTGFSVETVDARGRATAVLLREPAQDSAPLTLTLATELQERSDAALAGPSARGLVAVRPSDGALLAVAVGSAGGDPAATTRLLELPARVSGASGLGWGSDPELGFPAVLGTADGRRATVLGVAQALAAGRPGGAGGVRMLAGARPRITLPVDAVAPLRSALASDPRWAVREGADLVTVVFSDAGDAAALLAAASR